MKHLETLVFIARIVQCHIPPFALVAGVSVQVERHQECFF